MPGVGVDVRVHVRVDVRVDVGVDVGVNVNRKKKFICRSSGKKVSGYEVKWDSDGVKESLSITELAEMVV